MIRRRDPEAGAVESEELERLCDGLARVEAPFDEITRSRAEARLSAELERQPGRGNRRTLRRAAVLLAVGAAAGVALTARTVVTARRSRVAGGPEPALRFEPYVVAPTAGAGAATVPETLEQPASHLEVPAGWLVRASLGDAVAITLTGPARAWSERGADSGQTVVHLERGRLWRRSKAAPAVGCRSCRRAPSPTSSERCSPSRWSAARVAWRSRTDGCG